MTNKKNALLTFICSLMPGAGQMYMGFLRKGTGIMGLFFFIIFLSVWLNLGPLMFALPIIWCYSFFETHALRGLSDDEFYAVKDEFMLGIDISHLVFLAGKYKTLLGCIFVLMGFSILWEQIIRFFSYYIRLPHYLINLMYDFGHRVPQTLFALLIIFAGISLIRGQKHKLDERHDNE